MANYADRRVWMMTAAEAKLDEIRKEQATVDRTNKIYRQANKSIQERVQALYDELATQDPQNRWRFEGLNTPATLKSATALRKKIESAGLTDYVPERLQRRLSVYEVMELDNWYTMTKAGQDAHSTLKSALEAKIKDQGEIWQRALKAGGAGFVGFDRNQVGYMLGENWYGGNFSSRLWDETQANWGKVQEEIAKALASGQDPQVTRRKIAQILVGAHQDGVKGSGGLQYDVERIIRTEMARAATQADIIKWQNEGVDEVQWNATLEANTCEHCKERDGRVYKIKQARDSVPLHPNCRCFLTPYDRTIEENRTDRKRQYKDENGNYELIDWAPISALTKTEDGWKAAKVPAYFFQASPWTTYEPPKTTLTFTGEINEGYTELASRAIQDAINQYPEIGYELKNTYGNTIYEHRGMSATVGNGVDMIGGVVFPSGKNQVGVALAYPSTLSGTAKAIREKMAQIAAKQYGQGFWSTDKVQHTIIHEMGHVLENYIRKRAERRPGETIQDAGDRAILEILQAATGEKSKKNVLQGLTGISRYGSKNISEGFAELFARSMAQDTNLNNKTVAQFVSKLNQVREDLPQKARTTKINVVSEAQATGQKSTATTAQPRNRALTDKEIVELAYDDITGHYDSRDVMYRIAKKRGIDGTPTVMDDAEFENLNKSDYTKYTRGIRDDSRAGVTKEQIHEQTMNGAYRISTNTTSSIGMGYYVTEKATKSQYYAESGILLGESGAVEEFAIPKTMKMLDLRKKTALAKMDSMQKELTEINEQIRERYRTKNFLSTEPKTKEAHYLDIYEYIAAKGYDGIIAQDEEMVLFNRAGIIINKKLKNEAKPLTK